MQEANGKEERKVNLQTFGKQAPKMADNSGRHLVLYSERMAENCGFSRIAAENSERISALSAGLWKTHKENYDG